MKKSCGVIIETPSGVLIGHATRTSHWDLFKGGMDDNENSLSAARRECLEESGIDINMLGVPFIDLGEHPYRPGKSLHLFMLKLNFEPDLSTLKCTSMVIKNERDSFPEIDKYLIVPKEELSKYLPKNLYIWIESHVYPNIENSSFLRC